MKQDLLYLLPELVLFGGIVLIILSDILLKNKQNGIFSFLAIAALVAMMVANGSVKGLEPSYFFSRMVAFDGMGQFFKYIFGLTGIVGVVLTFKSAEIDSKDRPGYYTLLLALVFAMMVLSISNHLLMIYMALEMVSVLSYILTGSSRGVRKSSEAALKYVIYGGVASGIMAYGLSVLYGLTGTMYLPDIAAYIQEHAVSRTVLFTSVLMIMAGFAYKVAAFPFHMWSPDVYEGAPTPFTAFLAVGPKAAGFAILLRFFLSGLSHTPIIDGLGQYVDLKSSGWQQIIVFMSIATMAVGNLAALVQKNMKRLLAYSSIAHAGYMMMALAALNFESIRAIVFYILVYAIMNTGAFLVVITVSREMGVEDLEGYRGLGRRGGQGTVLAVIMSIFLFSLTGIPPFAGFIGKFYLFGAVVKSGLYGLAITGVLFSVVSLYYYVRVIKLMFFDTPIDERIVQNSVMTHSVLLSGLAFLTIYLGLFWNTVADWANQSAQMLH